MLKKGKSDPRKGTIVRKNGHVYRDRVCTVCSKDHWHGENMCIACRNAQQKKRRGVIYKKRKEHPWYSKRQKRLAAHAERIEREIKAIRQAGLDPATAVYHEYSVVLQSRTSSTYHNTPPGGGNETPCTNGKILVQARNEGRRKIIQKISSALKGKMKRLVLMEKISSRIEMKPEKKRIG